MLLAATSHVLLLPAILGPVALNGDNVFPNDIVCASQNPAAQGQILAQMPGALDAINAYDPSIGAQIQQGWGDGSVSIVPLDPTTSAGIYGASDANTIGLSTTMNDGEFAATLYHEWHHVRQLRPANEGGLPAEGVLSEACREAHAYCAELSFVCYTSTLAEIDQGEKPFSCHMIWTTWAYALAFIVDCQLGSPGAPVPPLPSPCMNYCS